MRLLLTRPLADSAAMAAELGRRGHDVRVDPMLAIVPRDAALPDPDGIQAVLATSANGVRELGRRWQRRDRPVFAVGSATAEAARAAGFADVRNAAGDAAALAALVADRLRPSGGPLLHAAGADRSPVLQERLAAAGFDLRTAVLYEAVPAPALSPHTRDALRTGTLDGVLLFSPRTAEIFVRLVTQADLARYSTQVDAFCLSDAVAERAAALPWRRTVVAERPEGAALLAAVGAA